MTFKEKLTILRKNKGLTQDDFAKAIGVSRQAVYKWESGSSYPEVPKLLDIKALYGISLDDLFDDSFEIAVPEKKKRKSAQKKEVEAAPVAEEPVEEKVEEPVAEEVKADPAPVEEKQPDVAEEKKIGFFGRLFGRK